MEQNSANCRRFFAAIFKLAKARKRTWPIGMRQPENGRLRRRATRAALTLLRRRRCCRRLGRRRRRLKAAILRRRAAAAVYRRHRNYCHLHRLANLHAAGRRAKIQQNFAFVVWPSPVCAARRLPAAIVVVHFGRLGRAAAALRHLNAAALLKEKSFACARDRLQSKKPGAPALALRIAASKSVGRRLRATTSVEPT